jgi:hypothetical protein
MSQMKKLLESLDNLQECPPEMAEGPGMAPQMDQGNPVTMNVSLNASGADHVQDLINMMKNAGLNDAKPADDAMMPMRQDMERLAAMMDEPAEEAIEEGGMSDIHAQLSSADDPAQMVMDLIAKGGPVGDYLYGELEQIAAEKGQSLNNTDGAEFVDELLADMGIEEGYANSPDGVEDEPEYSDHEKMTRDLSGGINREKKSFKAAQRGDNAMAVEAIKAQLIAALAEKKKPDADGDGVPDWADKKPGKDDNEGKKKGSKPKKGVVPPQFKK